MLHIPLEPFIALHSPRGLLVSGVLVFRLSGRAPLPPPAAQRRCKLERLGKPGNGKPKAFEGSEGL